MNREVKYALYAGLLVLLGMLVGFNLERSFSQEKSAQIRTGVEKFQEAMYYIEHNYVTETSSPDLVDNAIEGMLTHLDPHSFYIPAKEMQAMSEQMEGSFEGIGVEFNILDDTVYIVAPIAGGPSEAVGIQSGDRIVKVDGKNIAGIKVTNSDVMKYLKGPKGQPVVVGIVRRGVSKELEFTIIRDRIPLHSVDFSYMMDDNLGYMKVSRFASTTHDEFLEHLYQLKDVGMKNLILDLRDNPGGYMEKAQFMADEFLAKGNLVVYTEGRISQSKSRYIATAKLNSFEKGGLVVLIDYGSASASEIVSGAVQDWDRGLILGVRSFGKGMVQTQKPFEDGSAMRLVISKYYTPSGRCIQKPYNVSDKEYEEEILERFESGEIYDSTKVALNDSLKYLTHAGREVYGGGGIMPDLFVSRDTTEDSDYLSLLIAYSVFRQFSFFKVDGDESWKTQYPSAEIFVKSFNPNQEMMNEFIDFATTKNVDFSAKDYAVSEAKIKSYIKAFIGRKLFNDAGFFPVIHKHDIMVKKAVQYMPAAIELYKTGTFNQ